MQSHTKERRAAFEGSLIDAQKRQYNAARDIRLYWEALVSLDAEEKYGMGWKWNNKQRKYDVIYPVCEDGFLKQERS